MQEINKIDDAFPCSKLTHANAGTPMALIGSEYEMEQTSLDIRGRSNRPYGTQSHAVRWMGWSRAFKIDRLSFSVSIATTNRH